MKVFAKYIGAVLTVFVLLCGCGTEPVTSDIFDGSKVILSPAVKEWFDRDELAEKELVICAYDSRDVFGASADSDYYEKYKALELKKLSQTVEAEKDENLSENQRSAAKAQIESEFEIGVRNLEHEYIKAKYDALCAWFSERGVSAAPYKRFLSEPVLSVKVYSIKKEDLIALKDSGLHVCYTVDGPYPVLEPSYD